MSSLNNITFRGAGAGAGKTYNITQEVAKAIREKACRPAGLIATTFTRKAATELREKLRTGLYEAGLPVEAEQLGQALIGTVHGVAEKILSRFALEAGISPRIEVLDDDLAEDLLHHALDSVCDLSSVEQLQTIALRLAQRDLQTKEFNWRRQVGQLLEEACANGFSAADLKRFGQESVREFTAFFGKPFKTTVFNSAPTLIEDVKQAIIQWGDDTKTTAKYLEFLNEMLLSINNKTVAWGDWIKLITAEPAKRKRTNGLDLALDALKQAVPNWEQDPQFHADVTAYTTQLFGLAADALDIFQDLKEKRGALDFTDLERKAKDLICENQEVAAQLAESLDLLVVDEFQDTSPMQLALFVALAKCAKKVIWVGDIKQAIYGFRGSDPTLVDAVVDRLAKTNQIAPPLNISYRSIPELVRLVNEWFTLPFRNSLKLESDQVRLSEQRPAISGKQSALGIFNMTSEEGNRWCNKHTKQAVADGVHQLLTRQPPLRVFCPRKKCERELEPGDIAILSRKNTRAKGIAEALAERGIAASLSGNGLMATPEVCFALACLRRLYDRTDTLATAEIIALGGNQEPEQWLAQRLKYLETLSKDSQDQWGEAPGFSDPRILALEKIRPVIATLSVSEALDLAMDCADAFALVSAWPGPEAQAFERRANLEILRGLAARYEQSASTSGSAATITGFLTFCRQLEEDGLDSKASSLGANTVEVMTYHKAKGLEWPVVICCDLDEEFETRLFSPRVEQSVGASFDMESPLHGRCLRFWASPFGRKSKDIPALARMQESPQGKLLAEKQEAESLRLLYVGFTRARDLLVLAVRPGNEHPWLNQAEDVNMKDPGALQISARASDKSTKQTGIEFQKTRVWFSARQEPGKKLPARLTPSKSTTSQPLEVLEVITLDWGRLPLRGHPEESMVGDAVHTILAAEFQFPDHPKAKSVIEGTIKRHELQDALSAEAVHTMATSFRRWVQGRFQPKQTIVEVPFHYHNELGQLVTGFIDLLLETAEGWVIVDHKTFPGPSSEWKSKAQSYSGQIRHYVEALLANDKKVASAWVHLATGGGMVRLQPIPPH
jgi:ATP-dependent exoDNAse (exonuclease V) beta subunit